MTETTMNKKEEPRYSGILIHPTSFPSPYGIGDLGKDAYEFIDFLQACGQTLWQVLPLGPTGFGDSPYQSFSAFAGQTLLISPEKLMEQGLLTEEDLASAALPDCDPRRADFGRAIECKAPLFKKAFEHFFKDPSEEDFDDYLAFCKKEAYWLEDYVFYMACKDEHDGACFTDWPKELLVPTMYTRYHWTYRMRKSMRYYRFMQYLFEKQWQELHAYANEKGISIIGDIPIFTAFDSADVWAHPTLFLLDSKGYPLKIAGVPPDYFSEDGQLWGNPLYNWDVHKEEGFSWWIDRVRHQLSLTDYLRIDHFRGFEACWAVPADAKTAKEGEWMPGPADAFFEALADTLGDDLPIIAEDLGIITEEVSALRDKFGLPGMKILQFAFEDDEESDFLPHQFKNTNCVCYTGTHDNDTTLGWYRNTSDKNRDKVRRYMNTDGNCISWDFIRTCLGTIAKFAIFPMQDVLQMGSDARMNIPGACLGNWGWRYCPEDLQPYISEYLSQITKLYGR